MQILNKNLNVQKLCSYKFINFTSSGLVPCTGGDLANNWPTDGHINN